LSSKFHEVRGSLLFTTSGMQYFHVFNISLCGREPVNCANNITFQAEGEPKSVEFLSFLNLLPVFIVIFAFESIAGESVDLPDDTDTFAECGCFRRKQSPFDTISDVRRPPAWNNKRSPVWGNSGP
jgi:hypothetical protein